MKEFELTHLRAIIGHVLALRRKPLDPLWASSPTGARSPTHAGPPRVLPRSPLFVPAWAQHSVVARDGVLVSSQPWAWIEDQHRVVPAVSPEFPGLPGTKPAELLTWTGKTDSLWLDTTQLPAAPEAALTAVIDASARAVTRLGCRVESDPAVPVCLWLAHYHGLRLRGQQIKPADLSLFVFDLGSNADTPLGVALLGTDPVLLEDIHTTDPGVLARPLGAWIGERAQQATPRQTVPRVPHDLRAACELLLGPQGDAASRLGRAVVLLMKHLNTPAPQPPTCSAVSEAEEPGA